MRILLSNDDGVFAKGIEVMHRYLSQAHTVTVIAPDRNCSGMSSALSLQTPAQLIVDIIDKIPDHPLVQNQILSLKTWLEG